MVLKLWAGDIPLPTELNFEERKEYVNAILSEHESEFQYSSSESLNRAIEVRLDILGTYMLNSVPDVREDVMSRYKQKARVIQEKPFSAMSEYSKLAACI